MIKINHYLLLFLIIMLNGCLGMPQGVKPVDDFELNKYLGTWYEVARLDHSFERGLDQVTAEYVLQDDGCVNVINRGFSLKKQQWQEANGRAYFVESSDLGYLKVSFFGPFYGSYVIFGLDKSNYQYAFVSGPDLDYLWLLARTKTLSPEVITQFTDQAQALGFETDKLIFVNHQ